MALRRSVYSLIAVESTGEGAPGCRAAASRPYAGQAMESDLLETVLAEADADLRSLVVIERSP